MKGVVQLADPVQVEITIAVTASVAEWKQLHKEIGLNWPGGRFRSIIDDAIDLAERKYNVVRETPS